MTRAVRVDRRALSDRQFRRWVILQRGATRRWLLRQYFLRRLGF